MNKTVTKNGYHQIKAELKFPKNQAAFGTNKIIERPLSENSPRLFRESVSHRKPLRNRLLNALHFNDFRRLQPFLEPVALTAGKILFQPQDRINYLYFPETAVVCDLQMLEDGRTVEISMTGKEGVVGLSSVFNTQFATNWTEVVVAGHAFRLNVKILKQECLNNHQLQSLLFKYVQFHIEKISQKIICSNYHQLKERFCSWLLMLYNRNGNDGFSLTHEQIARFLGVHRPGISQIAHELRDKGIISYQRGQIFILNVAELENLTCSCFYTI